MRMSWPRLVVAALALFPAALVGACSAPPEPQAPPSPDPGRAGSSYQQKGYPTAAATASPTVPGQYPGAIGPVVSGWANLPPPVDVPGGLAQIDAAEKVLAALLPGGAGDGDIPPGPSRPDRAAEPLALDQACTIACSALASMKRSADHVCTMAGDKDTVCGAARERVSRAEARVTAACPACAK